MFYALFTQGYQWVPSVIKGGSRSSKAFVCPLTHDLCAARCRAEMLEKARQIAGQQSIRKALQEADYSE